MSDLPAITTLVYDPDADILPGLTQNEAGYVHSAWFTYDIVKHHQRYPGETTYDMGSHWQGVLRRSVKAFSEALGIRENQVVVSSINTPDDLWKEKWRLGTAMPLKPIRKPKPAETKISMPDAIDI